MTTSAFLKIIADSCSNSVGILIGTLLVSPFAIRRRTDISHLRALVGKKMSRFANIPAPVLDAALLSAAQKYRRGWRGIVGFLTFPALLYVGMVAGAVIRATSPAGWSSSLLVGLTVGVGVWLVMLYERRLIIQHIEQFHPNALSVAL